MAKIVNQSNYSTLLYGCAMLNVRRVDDYDQWWHHISKIFYIIQYLLLNFKCNHIDNKKVWIQRIPNSVRREKSKSEVWRRHNNGNVHVWTWNREGKSEGFCMCEKSQKKMLTTAVACIYPYQHVFCIRKRNLILTWFLSWWWNIFLFYYIFESPSAWLSLELHLLNRQW